MCSKKQAAEVKSFNFFRFNDVKENSYNSEKKIIQIIHD